jgi:hypothetical protein
VAVWRTTKGQRFQNYRAAFTVLDAACVSREWITQVLASDSLGSVCPPAWRAWVQTGTYNRLLAPPTVIVRTRDQPERVGDDVPLAAHDLLRCIGALGGGGHGGGGLDALGVDHARRGLGITALGDPG